MLQSAQTAARRILASRGDREALKKAGHIILRNVPRTATPADIRREINKVGVRGVYDIAIDYEYFKPAERAILTLVSPNYLQDNLRALNNLAISGISIQASPYITKTEVPTRQRMRGHQGRLKAAQRGALTGHGPRAGIANNETTVVLGGLPARTSTGRLASELKKFQIAQSAKGEPQIVKLSLPPDTFSMTAKFLITLTSTTEAHRFVRKLHASYFRLYGEEIPVTAKLIL
ncbi:hypothetical protein D9756_001923 [Leucocoprinus leucothites]|uniref:Uncharacterized protein n=1 Tax=Leucocoprinus leucothites TaxID=201217 RepID=A0A8H5G558_9AGAR|nr:hypothetical protein D9756_001923 [Leucoagaricus leucothites]